MILKHIHILNFKNIAEADLTLSSKVNCFTGMNGMGKTNLLDAVYYLSFCKSFTNLPDRMIVNHDADFSMIQAEYIRRGEPEEVKCSIQRGKRKLVRRNGKEYPRLSDHIGLIPLVMVSPQDWELLRGGSEERRRLVDLIISQNNREYLADLIRYNKAVEQRNSMIRAGMSDELLYESVETEMCRTAQLIHKVRKEWIQQFTPIFHRFYSLISDDSETVSLVYNSALNDATMAQILKSTRAKDMILGYTSQGVHRDDIDLNIGEFSMRKVGSQGQCKTYTIALRLAQYEFLREACGIAPILLLDDIFDKLDSARVERIVSIVSGSAFGQIFITDTNRMHIDEIISRIGNDYKIFTVDRGECRDNTSLVSHETI